jgi:hypothetical protein
MHLVYLLLRRLSANVYNPSAYRLPIHFRLTKPLRLRAFVACLTALLLTLGLTALAQTSNNSIDASGDIAFVAYGGRDNGVAGFAFVLLDNCPNNQSIFFTDEEWTGTAFGISEGDVIWTNNTGATIPKGTVIKIAGPVSSIEVIAWTSSNASVNIGSIVIQGSFSTTSGDQIFAITGNRTTPGTFLAFVGGTNSSLGFDGTPFGSGTVAGGNLVVNPTYACVVTVCSKYNGSTLCNGTVNQCVSMINTAASWSTSGYSGMTSVADFNNAIPNNFCLGPQVTPSVSIAANPGTTITSGTSVTFTATPTNGGTPSYQWKKNNNNVGTNSNQYTDAALANNDVIKVVMTSTDVCASPTTATSSDVTIMHTGATPTITAGFAFFYSFYCL